MSDRNDLQVSDHFWAYEIACPCCGRLIIRPLLLAIMDEVRNDFGKPLSPTSWCRCIQKNKAVYDQINEDRRRRGLKTVAVNTDSPHIMSPLKFDGGGLAVDYPIAYLMDELDERERWFRAMGAVGVGFGLDFTHVDVKPRPGEGFRSWIYNHGKPQRRTVIRS
jgi:hypothetical protein